MWKPRQNHNQNPFAFSADAVHRVAKISSRESESTAPKAQLNGKELTHAGFLLLNTSLHALYANREAVVALTYSGNPRMNFEERVRSHLAPVKALNKLECRTFIASGRRCYQVRVFSVKPLSVNSLRPALAVLLERHHKSKVDVLQVSERFRLTKREAEVLCHIAQGLKTNQIAEQMQISPCTVKAFLRSIMMRMRTNSRAGIMARILQNGDWIADLQRRVKPKIGDWIILKDGKRRRITDVEKEVAFYGYGDYDLLPFKNLIPASSGEANCWMIHNDTSVAEEY